MPARCSLLMRLLRHIQVVAALALAHVRCSHALEIETKVPFQVVRPTGNHTSMMTVSEGLRRLAKHDEPISVVSVVGPYHSGKSFLLNSLVGETGVFQIGRQVDPETMGIWLCRTDFKAQDGSEVWLMDSEGFFGPSVGETYDAKIFTIATLLGAHLVYNSVKVIDQQAVNLLEMLARRAQLFRTRSSAEISDSDLPEFLSVRSFPPLTWVVEDFVQELPQGFASSTAWLKSYLTTVNGTAEGEGKHEHFLTRLHSEVNVHTLFLPATGRYQLQDLSRVGWDELTPEFRQEIEALRHNILKSLTARRFEGAPMTGRSLERALRFIVQALQKGMFQDLPSLWSTWSQQVATMSLNDADSWFASLLQHIDNDEDPISVATLNAQVEEARSKTVDFYQDLLRDFEVSLRIEDLRNRMAVHFEQKVMYYHERIRRWMNDLIGKHKDDFSGFLQALELPLNPEELRKQARNVTTVYSGRFKKLLLDFAVSGAAVKLGRPAQMPIFGQEPATQLSNDLRALQGTRELENEREIEKFFKAARVAGDQAVENELKLNSNRLIGRARMSELLKLVERKCWNAFDETLARHQWMMHLHNYKAEKALVQTETYESRTNRFRVTNDQRLSTHFRTGLERTIGNFKTKQAALLLPVSETELDTEHRQLQALAREGLEEQGNDNGKDLSDTSSYKQAHEKLATVLKEGYHDMTQKNIELWTVHSDEARKCALLKNHETERHCALTCFFNKFPRTHRQTSEKHLMQCLAQTTGNRMSQKMQQQVFENWYNRDLAKDSARVWQHFYICTGLIGLLVLVFVTFAARQRSGIPSQGYYSPSNPSYQQPNYQAGYGMGGGMAGGMGQGGIGGGGMGGGGMGGGGMGGGGFGGYGRPVY